MPQRAQHTRLADAGLAGEQDVAALVARLDESFDDALARARDPEVGVRDVFAERRAHQTEMFEPLLPAIKKRRFCARGCVARERGLLRATA